MRRGRARLASLANVAVRGAGTLPLDVEWIRVVRVEHTASAIWRLRRWLVAGLLAMAALAGTHAAAASTSSSTQLPEVTIGNAIRPVPESFLGLSTETTEIALYETRLASFSRLLGKLRPPRDRAPISLRLGGESGDSSFWGSDPFADVAPSYQQPHPYVLTPAWMAGVSKLITTANLKVILDLNLAAHSPQMAAQVAAAARRDLPAGSITAFEVGNEPDEYAQSLVGFTRAVKNGFLSWAFTFGAPDYVSLFTQYVAAVRKVFPNAQFAGPDVTSQAPTWLDALLFTPAGLDVSLATAHDYAPYRGCAKPGTRKYPLAADYLRESSSSGMARAARFNVAATVARQLPLRLTEVGLSVCGGVPGQSDTFATALWAPDVLFSLLKIGVSGVNIHVRANGSLNTALNYTPSGIYPEPMFYGLALFARTLGPGAQLMQVHRYALPSAVKVWAVMLPNGALHVLFINKSASPTHVGLPAFSRQGALLQRLVAPSITANDTVTLAGQRLGDAGYWTGPRVTETVAVRSRRYHLRVGAFSAVLVSVPPTGSGLAPATLHR